MYVTRHSVFYFFHPDSCRSVHSEIKPWRALKSKIEEFTAALAEYPRSPQGHPRPLRNSWRPPRLFFFSGLFIRTSGTSPIPV
jgi:hypothetical protein